MWDFSKHFARVFIFFLWSQLSLFLLPDLLSIYSFLLCIPSDPSCGCVVLLVFPVPAAASPALPTQFLPGPWAVTRSHFHSSSSFLPQTFPGKHFSFHSLTLPNPFLVPASLGAAHPTGLLTPWQCTS